MPIIALTAVYLKRKYSLANEDFDLFKVCLAFRHSETYGCHELWKIFVITSYEREKNCSRCASDLKSQQSLHIRLRTSANI